MTAYDFQSPPATPRRSLRESPGAVEDLISHSLTAFNELSRRVRELEAENAELRERLGEEE